MSGYATHFLLAPFHSAKILGGDFFFFFLLNYYRLLVGFLCPVRGSSAPRFSFPLPWQGLHIGGLVRRCPLST